MMNLCFEIRDALQGRLLVTAESCTGGGIGALLTSVPGISAVYKGGVISYCNELKHDLLGVDYSLLEEYGAVSAPVAEAMAAGAKSRLSADVAISVTGLAGPDGDSYGNPVGTVYIGYCDEAQCFSEKYHFSGDREHVQKQAVRMALEIVLRCNKAEKIS